MLSNAITIVLSLGSTICLFKLAKKSVDKEEGREEV